MTLKSVIFKVFLKRNPPLMEAATGGCGGGLKVRIASFAVTPGYVKDGHFFNFSR